MFWNPWWSFDEIFIWTSSVIEDGLRTLFLIKFSLSPDICAGYHQSLMKIRWSFSEDGFRPSMKLWWEVAPVFIYGWWWPRTRFLIKFSSSPGICLAYHQAPEDVGMKPKVIIFFSRCIRKYKRTHACMHECRNLKSRFMPLYVHKRMYTPFYLYRFTHKWCWLQRHNFLWVEPAAMTVTITVTVTMIVTATIIVTVNSVTVTVTVIDTVTVTVTMNLTVVCCRDRDRGCGRNYDRDRDRDRDRDS